uniref:Putative ovule protein n=1 Tax=Solanum chacoense TaxID=4108 RepID=A0A0V0HL33_SOLCH
MYTSVYNCIHHVYNLMWACFGPENSIFQPCLYSRNMCFNFLFSGQRIEDRRAERDSTTDLRFERIRVKERGRELIETIFSLYIDKS